MALTPLVHFTGTNKYTSKWSIKMMDLDTDEPAAKAGKLLKKLGGSRPASGTTPC